MSLLASIAGALGFTPKAARLPAASRGRVIPDLALWWQSGRIGGGLTPKQVSSILREADTGYMFRLMDLANESRQKDCHLQAVLSVSEESIAGLPWQLTPPDDARAKDKRASIWLEGVLRGNPGFRTLLGHTAGAVYYSHSVAETVYKKDGGKIIPDYWARLAPRRFGYRTDDGAFILRDQGQADGGIDFLGEFPGKFVVSHPRVTGDVPQREGLVRCLVWAALFRNWGVADWLRTGETSWKPWRIGTYKEGSSPEQIDDLLNVLTQLTTNGVAVKSENQTIDIKWPEGGATTKVTHAELVNVLAQEMSKAVLGQTETVMASTSSGYAQAKVHDVVRKDLREARAKQVAADITRDLVVPLIEMNFGDVVPPRFEFITDDALDLTVFADAVAALAAAGTKIPQAWVRDQAGIPEPKPEEDILTVGGTAPAAGTNPDGTPKPDPKPNPQPPQG